MATFAELLVRIGGDATGFHTAMDGIVAKTDSVTKHVHHEMSSMANIMLGMNIQTIGTAVTAGLTLPIVGVGIAATKMASDFELGMRKVTSLMGGASQKEFKELSEQTLKLSRSLGVDAVNAADGLYQAISSGVPKENALSFLEIASKAAIAGLTDTRVAVDGMTTILQAFGLQTSETQKVADAMFQAVNIGKLEFPELAQSIGLAAGSAKVLGVSYQELLAAGATLTNTTGQKIPEAMTMLQSAMRAVIEPTKEMNALIRAVGFESGSALINAKGLEGGLQAITEAAGGNIEVLSAAFGRIEGFRAALGLSGDNAKRAAADLDSLKNSAGAATKAFEEIDKSTARQFTRLTTELKGVSIELGTALLPAVNSLLSGMKPLVSMVAEAATWFAGLQPKTQALILGIAGLAAAIGPLVVGFGLFVEYAATAGAAISGLVHTMGGLSGVLTLATPLVVALGAAIAGWAIYKAVTEIQRLEAEIDRLSKLQFAGVKATDAQAKEIAILEGVLRKFRVEVDSEGKSVEEYLKALRDAIKGLDEFKGKSIETASVLKGGKIDLAAIAEQYLGVGSAAVAAAKKRSDSAAQEAAALKRLKDEQQRLGEVVEKAELQYKAVARAHEQGKASADQLSVALATLTKAQRAADPGKWIEEQKKANDSFQKWAATLEQKMLNAEGNITKARLEWIAFSDALVRDEPINEIEALGYAIAHLPFPVLSEQLQRMANSASLLGGQMEKLNDIKAPTFGLGDLNKQTEAVIAAEKLLGVQTIKSAAEMRVAYETLKNARDKDGKQIILDAYTRLRIERDILAQEIKEAEAAGVKVSAARRKQLEDYEKILAGHGNKVKEFWRNLGREIEGIARGWAVDIGRGLWDTLLGKGRREFNRGLDEQTTDLRASLAERATEWAAYQADIEAQQKAAQQKYTDTLAEERAALDASLADRQKDYADAEAENARKLEDVRAQYAKELASTLADLAASLEERRIEYEAYVVDINDKLSATRREHADQLAAQLRDLENSLEDQRRSYDEYVKDVNKKLSRVGEDYAESIDDETKSVKAGIEDKQQEYKRDEEDILERIKRLKKAGKTEQDEEIQDLRKSLRRKQEDLEEYGREANEKLVEFTSDAQRRNEREVADLKESLAERTAEWTRYQAENTSKRTEAIAKNAADLAKDEADLAKSLANRTADWVKYQAENARKVDEANAKYTEGLAKEEADLAASLAKKKQALDDYVAEANAKWEKIQAAALASLNKEESDLAASFAKRQTEYDKFVTDTQAKLDALVAAHRTAWDDIGSMMVNAFERAGESLATFITDQLMGSLLNTIKRGGSLWGAFEELGRKVAGIFTGGAGGAVASTIPSLPGAIPGAANTVATGGASAASGAASAAASSAAAWVGVAATAIGTAITALGQAKMEGTLNAIEKESRYAQIHLYYLLERANLYWPYLQDIHWYFWNRQDKWFESLDNYALRIDSYVGRIITNLDERIAPAVEEARSWLQVISEILRDGFGSLPAAMVSAVTPIVAAVMPETPAGGATEPAERVATQVPGSVPTRRTSEPTRRGAAIPLPAAAQYGSMDWLSGLLARQEATLANVLKGYDPNNPMSKEDWAAAYAANTGPAYQAWLMGAIANTKDMIAQWAAYAKAMAEAARALTAGTSRAIVVNLEGGSARDQEFAAMVIDRYTRQVKAGGLL